MELKSVPGSKIRSKDGLSRSRPGASTHLKSQGHEDSSLDATLTNASSINTKTQIDGGAISADGVSRLVGEDCLVPFKESVGHTSNEVYGGAVLGFFVGLLVHNLLR